MGGLQTGIPARDDGTQGIQFFRKRFSFDGSAGQIYTITPISFVIPANSIILSALSGADTQVVFNAGTANRVQIGIAGAVSKYGLNVTVAALGFAAMAVAVGHRVAVDTTVIFTPDITGTAPTTGEVECVLAFINAN